MTVIGIAGLPGSGKTHLVRALGALGFVGFDDVNRDWYGNLPYVHRAVREGRDVAIADIVFCNTGWRERLGHDLGLPVRWIFFDNAPWRCAANCLHRVYVEGESRSLLSEMRKIIRLSASYRPGDGVRPVFCRRTGVLHRVRG